MPPPTPEQLVALTRAVDSMVMRGIVGAKFSGFPADEVAHLCDMPASDVEMLQSLAPYAAEYLPLITQYLKPVMAVVFVGTWSFSVVTRSKAIATLHEQRFPERYRRKSPADKVVKDAPASKA